MTVTRDAVNPYPEGFSVLRLTSVMPMVHNLPMNELEAFIEGYVETLLWTGWVVDGEEITSDDLRDSAELMSKEALASVLKDCEDFWTCNEELLKDLDPWLCGSNFLLTRNRHGTGFWDRGLGKLGEELTEMSHPYGESNAYFLIDEHKVVVAG
jgi:hypothetical protein